ATRAGRHASLVHDAAEGGLAVALAEAALWSGVGAELDLDDEPLTLFGEIGGQVIVAVPAGQVEPDPTGGEIDVRRIGTVGGDALFGIPLEELAHAHEGTA
ncbi:MAG: AIR synthase-related protein, partial [Gaiella sp.]